MKKPLVKLLPYFLIACSFFFSMRYLGKAWLMGKQQHQSISVTGMANKDFTSDLVTWTASFNRKAMNMQDAFSKLKLDAVALKEWLLSKGINNDEIVFSSVNINKEYDYINIGNGQSRQEFAGYNLSQNVTIESKSISKVEEVSREVTSLIEKGLELNSGSPEFFYTKLGDLKIEMIAEATKNGRTRAEQIAKNAGNDLGNLKSADMGIFQITGRNSTENYSWGGTFNTSSKFKTATITVKLNFEIE